ncbi:hypothetical protein [Streptomyces sp. NPDC054829]
MIREPSRDLRRDLYAAGAAALLVAVAAVLGTAIQHRDGTLRVNWPPLLARWDPHLGPGTPAALAVAVAVVVYGPPLAARLPWRGLLFTAWGTGTAWILSLALIDGWHRGIARRLTTRYEYLQVIDRFQDIPATLRTFTDHILLGSPDNWPAHVAGHPPAATLTFVYLDRIGLGGGAWAGMWCVVLGATAAVAILVTVRALADEQLARRAAPFVVLAPGAVWLGASADAYFAAVATWAVALLALAVTGRHTPWTAFGSGLLFGLTLYLSYGLTLYAVLAATVLLLGRSRARPLLYAIPGFLVIPLLFTGFGFFWWEAYDTLVTRYYQGAGGVRPQSYWVWANLACQVLVTGLATAAGLRRTATTLLHEKRGPRFRLALLTAAALTAMLVADLSGMSKAETERIWLPFALWLIPSCAHLPSPRAWLAAQAILALLINHLLFTGW